MHTKTRNNTAAGREALGLGGSDAHVEDRFGRLNNPPSTTSNFRKYRLPIFETRPSHFLPPDESCLGVRPRKAATSRGPEKVETSWTLATASRSSSG
jgi:hypothetical protein